MKDKILFIKDAKYWRNPLGNLVFVSRAVLESWIRENGYEIVASGVDWVRAEKRKYTQFEIDMINLGDEMMKKKGGK